MKAKLLVASSLWLIALGLLLTVSSKSPADPPTFANDGSFTDDGTPTEGVVQPPPPPPKPVKLAKAKPIPHKTAPSVGIQSLTDGLGGYWPLDENNGSIASDSSGNGNTGIIKNASGTQVNGSWVASKFNNALSISNAAAATRYTVNIAHSNSLSITGSLTVSTWVWLQSNNMSDTKLMTKAGAFDLRLKAGALPRFSAGTGTISVPNSCWWVWAGSWYHVAGTYEPIEGGNATLSIYINGLLANSTVTNATLNAPNVDLILGDNAKMKGKLDDVRVYGRALSTGELITMAGAIYVSTSSTLTPAGSTVTFTGKAPYGQSWSSEPTWTITPEAAGATISHGTFGDVATAVFSVYPTFSGVVTGTATFEGFNGSLTINCGSFTTTNSATTTVVRVDLAFNNKSVTVHDGAGDIHVMDEVEEKYDGAEIRLNSNFDEGNKDINDNPVEDFYPDATVGDRITPNDPDLLNGTLKVEGGTVKGKWKLIFPSIVKVWKQVGSIWQEVASDILSDEITLPLDLPLRVEGIDGSVEMNDVQIRAVFVPSDTGNGGLGIARNNNAGHAGKVGITDQQQGEDDYVDDIWLTSVRSEFMLSFDDGPYDGKFAHPGPLQPPAFTSKLLERLDLVRVGGAKVKAAFFQVGKDGSESTIGELWLKEGVDDNPQITVLVEQKGHVVGNHTHHHQEFDPGDAASEVVEEITFCNGSIT